MPPTSSPSTVSVPPVVIAGMHRSGTSLVASYLSSLGIHMGDRLLPADFRNPHGYFEDADFVALHGRILSAATMAGEAGHRDWGWTESEWLDRDVLTDYFGEARDLAEGRIRRGGIWGWKDPRTSLLLDFWDEVLGPQARYVLVYRFPWEVADSMQRLGADVFLRHPEWAYPIWTFYNRHVLDFHRRHPDRSVLVSTNALMRDPARFVDLLRGKLGLNVADAPLESVRDRDLFVSLPPDDPLIPLVAATSPAAARVLGALDAQADLPATDLWNAAPPRGERWRPEGEVDFSVVIPCYDLGELLVEALASAERSAGRCEITCEIIIVNDGSRQPRTLEVLGVLRDAGYPVLDQPNSGLAAARNRGIGEARGRIIIPLDADNRLLPGYPAAALRVFDADPRVGVVYGDRLDFGLRAGRTEVPELDLGVFLWANSIDACAAYRRKVWEECGGYDAGALVWEDWELWIAAAERGWRFHRLDEPTFEYRVRPDSMIALAQQEGLRPEVRGHIYRKHRGLYADHLVEILLEGHQRLLATTKYAVDVREQYQRENAAIATDARALRAARDRLQIEIDLLAAGQDPRREEREAEVAGLREALAERERRLVERENELAWSRQREAEMKATRAWRLREAAVRLKHRLLRKPQATH
ncbi:MAG TPA: glycosyltransferase [Thermoanaerobaculia bacterium]|jgi:glycosyltransferase involved in cell wall biosynthesis|nr:glycosyltransferase [Thermoanaerobaculia bacterium]